MSSMFEDAENLLDDLFLVVGEMVEYRRNGKSVAKDIPAKISSQIFRSEDRYGMTLRTEAKEFIFRYSDIEQISEPKNNDEIIFAGSRYLVGAPNGEPCWKWHTRHSNKHIKIYARYLEKVI